jgi:hypothetical protein
MPELSEFEHVFATSALAILEGRFISAKMTISL